MLITPVNGLSSNGEPLLALAPFYWPRAALPCVERHLSVKEGVSRAIFPRKRAFRAPSFRERAFSGQPHPRPFSGADPFLALSREIEKFFYNCASN